MAKVPGKIKGAELLKETKDEEAETDATLNKLAEKVNQLVAEMNIFCERLLCNERVRKLSAITCVLLISLNLSFRWPFH